MNTIQTGFYAPDEITNYYPQIADIYASAFADPPWNEVSTCRAPNMTESACQDGLSPLVVGEQCSTCGLCPTESAYRTDELVSKFQTIADGKTALWYLETDEDQLTMCALAWVGDTRTVATEKYATNPDMTPWLESTLPDDSFIWLDEVFANRSAKPSGNLANFSNMVNGFSERLELPTLAYRTITPQMLSAARRIGARIWDADSDELPDRRSFVRINTNNV